MHSTAWQAMLLATFSRDRNQDWARCWSCAKTNLNMFEDPERLQGVLLESSPGCHVELVHMTVGLPLFTSNSSELELITHSWNYCSLHCSVFLKHIWALITKRPKDPKKRHEWQFNHRHRHQMQNHVPRYADLLGLMKMHGESKHTARSQAATYTLWATLLCISEIRLQ